MKNVLIRIMTLLIVLASFTSCELAKGIFKAGVWVGILIVVGVIGLIIWLISRIGGGGGGNG